MVLLFTLLVVFPLSASAGEPGSEVLPNSDAFVLTLGGHSFDPLDQGGVADLFSAYQSDPSGDYHLLQFEGPIRSHWLQGLRQNGIEVVQYVHPYTYIVWAEQTQMNAARSLDGVRWSGSFLPEFRVIPEQRGFGSEVEPTNLLVSRYANQRALHSSLDSLGVEVLRSQPYLGHFMLLETAARGDVYMDLGRVAAVYTVQQAIPMAPRGEMSNQAIVDLGFTSNQNALPGYADWLTTTGYDGSGVTVSIIDGGVRESHQDLAANMVTCVSQGSPTSCTAANDHHGTHVAGGVAGNASSGTTDGNGYLRGQGVAPGASLVQQRYQSSGLTYGFGSSCSDPDSYCTTPSGMLVLFKEAALSGAKLANNSWGSTGIKIGYDLPSQQVDVMTRDANPDTPDAEPVLPVWSIMNGAGDTAGACNNNSLGAPDEAKNLFAVGSTQLIPGTYGPTTVPNPSDFFSLSANSAHGPACDGRVGVHIVAPGCGTDAPNAGSDSSYGVSCGTSMASPVTSGALAVFIERYRDQFGGATPSPAMMKAAMMAVAANMHGSENADGGTITETPSRFQGFGRLDLDAAVNPANDVMYFDQETVFTATGQDWTLPLVAADPTEPVRIMMVFTDAFGHGLGGTTPAWVNDLDLAVSVDGDLYLGNQIGADGFSETGGSADGINNMEAVFLRSDQHNGNVFSVSVQASNIAADAINPHDPGDPSQDFALVCYNCQVEDATFSVGLDPDYIGACVPNAASEDHDVLVEIGTLGAYTGTVNLAASGVPSGVDASFDPDSVVAPGTSDLVITVADSASVGTSTITVSGDDGDQVQERNFTLALEDPLLSGPALNAPANGVDDLTLMPTFDWDALPDVVDYRIQVATDAEFGSLVLDEVVEGTDYQVEDELETGSEYFWRVQGLNLCGGGAWSDAFSFTTRMEPEADFSETSFAFVVYENDSDSAMLEIFNVGTGNLTFDIETDMPETMTSGRAFEGHFHPDNWGLINDPVIVGGSVDIEDGPPVEVYVTGGNDGTAGVTDFQIEIPMDGTIHFDWGYQSVDSGDWDSGGYAINGTYTELADNGSQVPYFNQSATVEVSAGDLFAFRVNTLDGQQGAGIFGATNFEFSPAACGGDVVPANWLSASPATGSIPAGDSEPVTVSVDSTGLAPGSYDGFLCVSTNDPGAVLVPMQVALTVEEGSPPAIPVADITPASFDFQMPQDSSDSDQLLISNIGDGELTWTVAMAEAGEFAITGDFDEDFEDVTLLPGAGWVLQNNSDPQGVSDWFQGNEVSFPAHEGPDDSYAAANFANTSDSGTISNWLLTPEFAFNDGTEIRFWTRSIDSNLADRLQVRLSTAGASDDVGSGATDVGEFSELLVEINEDQSIGGYPGVWTEHTITLNSGHDGLSGRVAFRYYAEDSGPSGTASDYIGIDTFSVSQPEAAPVPGCEDPGMVSWLEVVPGSGSTLAGDTSEVTVMVDSHGLAAGDYDALLCMTTNDPALPATAVPVTMTVLEPGELAIDVGEMAFGEVPLNQVSALSLTVSNAAIASAASLELDTIGLVADAEFTVTGGDCAPGAELAPGDSCTLEVSFAPLATGEYSGTLAVDSSDGQGESVVLSGLGIELPDEQFHDRFEVLD